MIIPGVRGDFLDYFPLCHTDFPGGPEAKTLCPSAGGLGLIPGQGDPMEEGMATHSSILAWETSWTEEPGGLQSMGWQRVGHD